jgi:hypothetical protein
VPPELQNNLDSLKREIAAAQQSANDGGGGVLVEINDGGYGGAAEPAQPAVQYGACRQNATDQQGYVALAGDEDGGAKDGPCDKCVIL